MELILYYTLTGTTKRIAEKRAGETGAKALQVQEQKKRSMFGAFLPGCFQAMRGKAVPIRPLSVDWDAVDTVVLAAPIWAGHPAPAINTAANQVPAGKRVRLILVSGGGESNSEPLEAMLKANGCEVVGVEKITPEPQGHGGDQRQP